MSSSCPARFRGRSDPCSLFTEERNSLLGGDDDGSGSELSANLCEIEESDAETETEPVQGARHTDV